MSQRMSYYDISPDGMKIMMDIGEIHEEILN